MTALPPPVDDALEGHEAFTPIDDEHAYALETTVFETTVTATSADGERNGEFTVTVVMPTLDAATDDDVAPVVEDGWFETFERRLEDIFSVAQTSTHDTPRIERDLAAGEVRVILEYVAWDATEGVDDAKTLIEYVEGTYAQGIIPGYSYRGSAAALLTNAQQAGREAETGSSGPRDEGSGRSDPRL
ncbi:DUF5813 family protein [Natronosalvus vescus]|uniref:DUF5813 family protein n=1 Tax=Natronosalvus vescus TaxID=2953881 RepID=UPI0020915630|nr:DUF5813 family protein [Natronosalvus vescus]